MRRPKIKKMPSTREKLGLTANDRGKAVSIDQVDIVHVPTMPMLIDHELPQGLMDEIRSRTGVCYDHGGFNYVQIGCVCPCGYVHQGEMEDTWECAMARNEGKGDASYIKLDDSGVPDEEKGSAVNGAASIMRCANCGRVTVMTLQMRTMSVDKEAWVEIVGEGSDIDQRAMLSEGRQGGTVQYIGDRAEMMAAPAPSTVGHAGGMFNMMPREESKKKLH